MERPGAHNWDYMRVTLQHYFIHLNNESQKAPEVSFHNRGSEPLTLFWINHEGKEQQMAVIQPGKKVKKTSTMGHRFRVRGANGFSKTFEVKKKLQTFELQTQKEKTP